MVRGYVFILTAAFCWGFIGIFSSIAFRQGLEPLEVAFWRALFAWLCFGTQAIVSKETHLARKDIPLLAVFGVLGVFLFYAAYQYAVKTGGAALAAVLLYTAPAWVVVCSFFIYRERLGIGKITAVILVIAGVFLVSQGDNGAGRGTASVGTVAIIAGLVSGFCYSLYYTIGKYFSARYTSANLFLYVLPVGMLCMLPFVDFVPKNSTAWIALISVSLISTYAANYCYYLGVKYLEAGKASIAATIEPVVATVAAYFILGEAFSAAFYLGAAIIIAAVLITIRAR